ncbi:MAG: isoprenylcysteine carboxylmethyltransferase family protein [Planctomycetes bacterium]|nr:isoprenylcysteine carboxylmethyltransferase family protein [Planctomycetota bacterium]
MSLPFIAIVVVPALIFYFSGAFDHGVDPPWYGIFLGGFFAAAGLSLMISTIRLFAKVGEGTLAPWNPTQKLVVVGIYRRVRNPMISGVFCVLLGEASGLWRWEFLVWALIFIAGNMIYIPLCEEPGLIARFGSDYELYKQNVRRWVPSVKPWDGLRGNSHDHDFSGN